MVQMKLWLVATQFSLEKKLGPISKTQFDILRENTSTLTQTNKIEDVRTIEPRISFLRTVVALLLVTVDF